MNKLNPLVRQEDLDQYESTLNDYTEGQMDEERFVAARLIMGVYAQRQKGLHMVRTKIPAGWITYKQLEGLAEAQEEYSPGESIHFTTRQDIQFYSIKLEDTPSLFRLLAQYGITTREASGNTVRNITSCPMAGVCPREHVDVEPYIWQVAERFSNHPLTQSLPRKFKISFSGCESDCAQGFIQDLALIAVRDKQQKGFKILAGGGLGAKPHEAVVLEPFIDEQQLLPAIEAVLAMHDKYSDRKRRTRSRLKFLVDRFGIDDFRKKYQEELQRTQAAFAESDALQGQWRESSAAIVADIPDFRKVATQHQPGLRTLPIKLADGKITGSQLRGLGLLLEDEGLAGLRATLDQNLLIPNVAENRIESIQLRLAKLDLGLPKLGDNIISCPGTTTCPLGITASRHTAAVLSGGNSDLQIRINGCHNACANANIADIGLYGKGRRHFGRLVPSYVLQLGGNGGEDGALAMTGPAIPAARVPDAVQLIEKTYAADREESQDFFSWSRNKGSEYFKTLLTDMVNVKESEMTFLTRDHGDSQIFQVNSVGLGECAGSKSSPVDKLLLNAAYEANLQKSFADKNKFTEAEECLENRLLFAGQALLLANGQSEYTVELTELPGSLRKIFPDKHPVCTGFDEIIAELESFRTDQDELAYPSLSERGDDWASLVAAICTRLRSQAKMKKMAG